MQESIVNASGDIDSVIAAVCLNIRIGEGIANLKAVFPLATKMKTSQQSVQSGGLNRCLVAIQIDTGQPEGY